MLTHIVGKKDSKSKDRSDSSRSMRINKVKKYLKWKDNQKSEMKNLFGGQRADVTQKEKIPANLKTVN